LRGSRLALGWPAVHALKAVSALRAVVTFAALLCQLGIQAFEKHHRAISGPTDGDSVVEDPLPNFPLVRGEDAKGTTTLAARKTDVNAQHPTCDALLGVWRRSDVFHFVAAPRRFAHWAEAVVAQVRVFLEQRQVGVEVVADRADDGFRFGQGVGFDSDFLRQLGTAGEAFTQKRPQLLARLADDAGDQRREGAGAVCVTFR
jgi:hypothetical protein